MVPWIPPEVRQSGDDGVGRKDVVRLPVVSSLDPDQSKGSASKSPKTIVDLMFL